ncbi:O-antigen ligase family protein [Jannaschia pohangensis]|uniref:O-antigen ligase n=1 Tax=Jannaschia pohangensis TaxID=390807 RepID=A0A1I3TUS7_9RHOB|nr:O-antigen ligase family protein [Jannaschia pohangensis]SFJ74079.1 hypothetical protein SAMN04488095_3523 [Jannaschia pohangensis]
MTFASAQATPLSAGTERARLHWLVVLYLLTVLVPMAVNVGSIHLTTLRILLLLTTLPMTVRMLAGHYGRVLPTDWLFLGHVIWLALALAVNNPDRVIQQAPSVGMEFLGGYVLARACIRTRADFIALCRFLILSVLLLLPFTLAEVRSGTPYLLETIGKLPGIQTLANVYADKRLGLERAQLVFAHPIHLGLYCSVVFSMAFVALKGVMGQKRRLLIGGLVAFAGFLALSSGAFLAIALQFGLIAWAVIFARIEWRWWLLFGMFVAAYLAIDILSTRSPIRVFMSYATFSSHTAYWRSIIFEWGMMNIFGSAENDIPSSIWFGLGLNDWVRPSYMYSGSMDNFWLVMGVRYGVPGFFFMAAGWIMHLRGLMTLKLGPDSPILHIRRACVFTFLGLSFTLATVHIWGNVFSFVMFVIGATAWLLQPGAADDGDVSPAPQPSGRKAPTYTRFAPGAPRPALGRRAT